MAAVKQKAIAIDEACRLVRQWRGNEATLGSVSAALKQLDIAELDVVADIVRCKKSTLVTVRAMPELEVGK